MAQAKKHILPFFIPHLGCPTAEQVAQAIADLPVGQQADYELAFYGGSFTALPRERQEYYLEPARQALAAGRLAGVRVSTRPDCINAEVIELLRYYGVDTRAQAVGRAAEYVAYLSNSSFARHCFGAVLSAGRIFAPDAGGGG